MDEKQAGNATDSCNTNVRFAIYVVLSLAVCTVGIVGNCALLVTLLRAKRSSMNSLLVTLTAIDIVFLTVNLAIIFLYDMEYVNNLASNHLASVATSWILLYFARWSQLAGIWITVQIAFERWLAISRPIKGRLRLRQTKLLSAAIVFLSILYELPDFLCLIPNCETETIIIKHYNSSSGSSRDSNANSNSDSDYLANAYANTNSSSGSDSSWSEREQRISCDLKEASWATFEYQLIFVGISYVVMSFAAPLISVISFSVMTFRTIKSVRNRSACLRRSVMHRNHQQPTSVSNRYSAMIVLMSVVFLLVEMPAVTVRAILGLQLINIAHCTATNLYTAAAVCAMLYASVNFVLYCVCSRALRQRCRSDACLCLCSFVCPSLATSSSPTPSSSKTRRSEI